MADRLEIFPAALDPRNHLMALPLSKRPHLVRKVDGNGQTEWVKEAYSNRSNAKRSITRDKTLAGLEIRVILPDGSTR